MTLASSTRVSPLANDAVGSSSNADSDPEYRPGSASDGVVMVEDEDDGEDVVGAHFTEQEMVDLLAGETVSPGCSDPTDVVDAVELVRDEEGDEMDPELAKIFAHPEWYKECASWSCLSMYFYLCMVVPC